MKISPMAFAVTTAATLLLLAALHPALAHGRSHGHHRYGGDGHNDSNYRPGHHGLRIGFGYGLNYGRRYGGHRSHWRHRYGSGISFSLHAPVYVTERSRTRVIQRQRVQRTPPRTLPDMPMLSYIPVKSQDASAITADRRQCERLTWRKTRPQSRGQLINTVHTERVAVTQKHGGNILYPAASGAALGAIGGAIADDAGAGAAIGALLGATSLLLNGSAAPQQQQLERQVHVSEYVPAAGPHPQALREALIACMQARHYTV
jgi:hypothetical protein